MSGTYDDNPPRDHERSDETTHSDGYTEGADRTSYAEGAETVRHEERLSTGTETVETGSVRVRKHVETHPVEYSVPRDVEHVDTSERISVEEGDSGEVEVLDDGSVSIPIFEEVLVVTKRLVVRERVIVRKHTVVDEHTLQTELRREHVTVDADDSVDLEDNRPGTDAATDRDGDGDVYRDDEAIRRDDGLRDEGLRNDDGVRNDDHRDDVHTTEHRTDHEGRDRL